MNDYGWSEGRDLTDKLLEMGFLDGQTTFRKRYALAEYLDAYFQRKEKERERSHNDIEQMLRT